MYEVIIVGAGPAGLSAALMLGRCRRTVLVCDAGQPRNAASRSLHGFLTRDGIQPAELLRIGREELRRYEVQFRSALVTDARRVEEGFEVLLGDGTRERSLKLLLATGVVDPLPPVEGAKECYGSSVFHCPYCDGWEVRDRPIAVYGRGSKGLGLAMSLRTWSHDLVLCTDGPSGLGAESRERLRRRDIELRESRIERFIHEEGYLRSIAFSDGTGIPRSALFFNTGQQQRSHLAAALGCSFTRKGAVRNGRHGEAPGIRGLYVAGDASRDVQLAIVGAGEGVKAAFAINTELQHDVERRVDAGLSAAGVGVK
jgi:thioredoxin reductase